MKSFALIVNPASGRGKASRKATAFKRMVSNLAAVEILETTQRGSATDLAADAAQEFDGLIAVGGDGTLSEVLSGMMEMGLAASDLPRLGFLPCGTVNVAVRAFGLNADLKAIADGFPKSEFMLLDVGMVEYNGGRRPFLLWFGAGLDGVIIHALNAERSSQMGLLGLAGKTPGVARTLLKYGRPHINCSVNGFEPRAYASVIVANVGPIALGGTVTDAANPSDGELDVVGVPQISTLGTIGLGIRMVTSSLTSSRVVSHTRADSVTLHSDGDVPFQIDGEPVGRLPARVTVRRGAVRLMRT